MARRRTLTRTTATESQVARFRASLTRLGVDYVELLSPPTEERRVVCTPVSEGMAGRLHSAATDLGTTPAVLLRACLVAGLDRLELG